MALPNDILFDGLTISFKHQRYAQANDTSSTPPFSADYDDMSSVGGRAV